jgi:hypothetical protein
MGATEPTGHGHGVTVEPDRVSARLVWRFGLLLAALSVAAMLLMVALFRFLDLSAKRRDAATVDAAGLQLREDRLPPQPRLQVDGTRHWTEFRSAEEEQLQTYGWTDRSTGAVHIPITRAMELIAQRGVGPLPNAPAVVPAPAPTPAPGGRP